MFAKAWFLLALMMVSSSCRKANLLVPKPRVYPRIEFPERKYQELDSEICAFTLNYSQHAQVRFATDYFDEKPTHPCWFDVFYPAFLCTIHISYVELEGVQDYDSCLSDMYEIARQVNLRSNFMEDYIIVNQAGIQGVVLDYEGPAASSMHFFLSDKQRHFVRGALYFQTKMNIDSLLPIIEYVEEDIGEMINSFNWKQD